LTEGKSVAGVACKVQAAKYGALMMQSGITQIRWAAEVLTYMGDDGFGQ